ncbi:SDR family NAD(P)-dependent oxidoreductase [Rhodohalobacter sulfatireducens]|uniref:SDR family oxidoreductase n=1 Tax=Rhodohalobacter sulfatireducens TaxID=2911366 RepID=A0ABS9KIJ0_9BACT|nr:SDR family oxidoreductase [Rhodohalobacter sulfatireducens]MCG2590655.1 SDR family oxidoreductase [Rhodohalobacter sulfatireducens]
MVHTFDLTGKVILLTGGYGYLGAAAAESLLHHGGTVYILGRSEEKFQKVFDGHSALGSRLHYQYCDISSTHSIEEAFEEISTLERSIDVLINNAFYLGSFYKDGLDPITITDEEWHTGIDGTLSSVFRCIRGVIPHIEKSDSPRIINVASFFGIVAPDFDVYKEFPELLNPPHYGTAKAGVVQLTKYYASYLGERGITVNTITPGPYPSGAVRENEKFVEMISKRTLLKRIGEPEDLAGAFVFLASDASGFMTGQNIIVDGGWTTT